MVTREDLDAFFGDGWNRHDVARVLDVVAGCRSGSSPAPRPTVGVSEWVFTGTTTDGRTVEVNGCDLFTFREGKIAVKSSFFKNRTA